MPNVELKVFLVDDGCTDGTGNAVSIQFPNVKVIAGEGNLFWNRGMYRAWTEALLSKPDYYFWLNDDTLLNENAITTMLRHAAEYDNKCIVTGCMCSPSDTSMTTYGGIINDKVVSLTGKPIECETTNGNALLIPREIVDEVGITNPKFHHSRGDLEYGYRTRNAGFKVIATDRFVGTCERHDRSFRCFDPNTPIMSRIKYLYSPLGFRPSEVYSVSKMNGGFINGVKNVLITHLRTLFPKQWMSIINNLKKDK